MKPGHRSQWVNSILSREESCSEECVDVRVTALTWKFSLKNSIDFPYKGVTGLSLSPLGPEHDSSPDSSLTTAKLEDA